MPDKTQSRTPKPKSTSKISVASTKAECQRWLPPSSAARPKTGPLRTATPAATPRPQPRTPRDQAGNERRTFPSHRCGLIPLDRLHAARSVVVPQVDGRFVACGMPRPPPARVCSTLPTYSCRVHCLRACEPWQLFSLEQKHLVIRSATNCGIPRSTFAPPASPRSEIGKSRQLSLRTFPPPYP